MNNQIVHHQSRVGESLATREVVVVQSVKQPSDDSLEVDPLFIFRLLARRKQFILWTTAAFIALAGIACLLMVPQYRAESQIELLPEQAGVLSEGAGTAGGGNSTAAEDAMNFSLSLQTQVSILQSDALALRVIKELNLVDSGVFKYNPLIKTQPTLQAMALPVDQSPKKRAFVLKQWARHLKVSSVAGTRVISVQYSDPNPEVAAMITNKLVEDFVNFRFQVRAEARERAVNLLDGSLNGLREQATNSAKHLAELQQQSGLYGPSPDQDHNIIVSRLEQLNTVATEAQRNRESKGAIYNLARTGDPELVAGLVDGTSAAGGANSSAPSLLIGLRQQEATLNSQLAEAGAKYGQENPKRLQIKSQVDAIRGEIDAESKKIVGRAQQQYLAAAAAERSATQALAEQTRLANNMNAKAADYGVAKNESDSAQQTYQHLLEKAQEAGILAGIRSTDINIVSPAAAPGKPHSPNVPLYLAAGGLSGLLFGIAGAFFRDSLDTSLRDPEDIEKLTNMPVLGVIPRSKAHAAGRRNAARKKKDPALGVTGLLARGSDEYKLPEDVLCPTDSDVMEAFRAVRTALLLSRPDNPSKVLMVTSSVLREGKSFSALHLAAALAQNGSSVLLVDADLRRGMLSRNLNRISSDGLSTALAGSEKKDYQPLKAIPGVSFFACGANATGPAESLGSKKMAELVQAWRREFDFVVIDTPPILPVTDAAVLSPLVDGVLVVTRFAVTTSRSVLRTIRVLTNVRTNCFGILVNSMDVRSAEYQTYGGYGYSSADKSAAPLFAEAAGKGAR